jgi:hypothetical protein
MAQKSSLVTHRHLTLRNPRIKSILLKAAAIAIGKAF